MASWEGRIVGSTGMFSGGEQMDRVGAGDFGGVVGCTEDIVMSEWLMKRV